MYYFLCKCFKLRLFEFLVSLDNSKLFPQRETGGASLSINVTVVSIHGNHMSLSNDARISNGLCFSVFDTELLQNFP